MKEQHNRCAVCGEVFSVDELFFDHIIPLRLEGKNVKENCRLVCRHCNANRSFTDSQFELHLLDCLSKNTNFRNVGKAWKSSGEYLPDIVAERKNGSKWEKIFVEAKGVPSLSQGRISSLSEQMLERYERNLMLSMVCL